MAIACMTQKNKTGFFTLWFYVKQVCLSKKLKKFVNLYMKDYSTAEIRKHLLIVQRSQLNKEIINIKKTVNYLDYKIDHFDDQLLSFEKEKLAYEKRI